jgi:hypothetical protein
MRIYVKCSCVVNSIKYNFVSYNNLKINLESAILLRYNQFNNGLFKAREKFLCTNILEENDFYSVLYLYIYQFEFLKKKKKYIYIYKKIYILRCL